MLWIVLVGIFPLTAIMISFGSYNRFVTAAIGSCIKLLFVFGPGIGIIGMAHGLGGNKI